MDFTDADFDEVRRILTERGADPADIDEFVALAAGLPVEQVEGIIVDEVFKRIVDGYDTGR